MIYFLLELEVYVALLVNTDASLELPESTVGCQPSGAYHTILVINYKVSDRSHVFETPFAHMIDPIFSVFGLLGRKQQCLKCLIPNLIDDFDGLAISEFQMKKQARKREVSQVCMKLRGDPF